MEPSVAMGVLAVEVLTVEALVGLMIGGIVGILDLRDIWGPLGVLRTMGVLGALGVGGVDVLSAGGVDVLVFVEARAVWVVLATLGFLGAFPL